MSGAQFLSLFFITLFAFILYQLVLILSPFFQAIFWSGVLAFSFYPIQWRLRRALGGNGTLAAILTTLVIFLAFAPLIVLVVFNLAAEAVKFHDWVLQFIQEGRHEVLIERLRSLPLVQRLRSDLRVWDFLRENSKAWMLNVTGSLGRFTAEQAAAATKNLLLFTLNSLLALFLLFFFLRDGQKVYRFIYEMLPLEEKNKSDISRQLVDTFRAVIQGQVFTALAQAIAAGLIFWMLSLPLPVFFASLTFLFSLVPITGAATVWFPFALYLFAIQSYGKAIILLLLGVFGISMVDNFIKPWIIGERTKLPYLLLFLSILGGLQVYGLVGIFLAPTVLSLFFALLKIYKEKFLSSV